MTNWSQPMPVAQVHWKRGLLVGLRAILSVAVLFGAYFALPAKHKDEGSDLPWLVVELLVFAVVVAVQVPAIVKARHPVLRAVEALAILIPVYLLIFSRIYLSSSLNDPSAFSRSLDNTTALYFTVTVFASVGFGDIVAKTNGAMLLVTLQMLLNLVVLGLVIRVLATAARRGMARRGGLAADPGVVGGGPGVADTGGG